MTRASLPLLVLGLFSPAVGVACVTPNRAVPPAARALDREQPAPVAGPRVAPRPGVVVARVGEEEIGAGELLARWLQRDSATVRDYLEELVLSYLVRAEAQRFRIELDPSRLEALVAENLTALEAKAREADPELSLDDAIRRRGLDPETYRARLADDREVDLLAERCVRRWLLASERAEVRVIVVDRESEVQAVSAALAAGESFAKLAERYSDEDSAAEGGRVPPVVRGNSALSQLAFSTPVGQVGGPVFERDRWLFLRVDARPERLEGDWGEVGAAVEASLSERAIEDPEYWQWKNEMLDRYEVDMTPFLDLVGQPAP